MLNRAHGARFRGRALMGDEKGCPCTLADLQNASGGRCPLGQPLRVYRVQAVTGGRRRELRCERGHRIIEISSVVQLLTEVTGWPKRAKVLPVAIPER